MAALDALLGQLDAGAIERMASQLGASPQQTQDAIQAALPLLLGAMQRKIANNPEAADALHGAVTRDHQGIDLGGLFGSLVNGRVGDDTGGDDDTYPRIRGRAPIDDGRAILGHVFGDQQPRAAAGVARAAGIDKGMAARLLAMLAPMLMGALGRTTQQRGLNPGALGGAIGQDVERMDGGKGGRLQQILSRVLDSDGDGDFDAKDLLRAGAGLLTTFMSARAAGAFR